LRSRGLHREKESNKQQQPPQAIFISGRQQGAGAMKKYTYHFLYFLILNYQDILQMIVLLRSIRAHGIALCCALPVGAFIPVEQKNQQPCYTPQGISLLSIILRTA
jgi:hypothetical protein